MATFQHGDKVSWQTPQGITHGTVVDIITTSTERDGHRVAATTEEPRYEVASATSGKRAVHKAEALTKED